MLLIITLSIILIAMIVSDISESKILINDVLILIALMYGISDEFHQSFVPGRATTFADFLLDSTGILFAGFIYVLSLSRRK